MTPLTWLRSRRTPPKPEPLATSSVYLPGEQGPEPVQPFEPRPGPVIQIRHLDDDPLTQDEIDALRDTRAANYRATLAVHYPLEPGLLDKPLDAWTMCLCFAVYSRCYCPART